MRAGRLALGQKPSLKRTRIGREPSIAVISTSV
jgi:hypothetical protein